MMRPHWVNLSSQDRAAFRATTAFLNGRLEERATVDWALRLKPDDVIKRLALLDLIGRQHKIREPWLSAWRLIEESLNSPTSEDPSTGVYRVQNWLRAGDRSGALVAAIVALVAPQLRVKPISGLHPTFGEQPRRPKKVEDLFATELTSAGDLIDLHVLGLDSLTERSFLVSLALALDAAVAKGLDIARRIGWDGEHRLWQLGLLYRVYYVPITDRTDGEHDPDESHSGIAPSVKLLHAVVSRLIDIDISAANEFICRWELSDSIVYVRLWAALSLDSRVTSANKVFIFLMSLDDRRFWDLHDYPEIAELRAMRFGELEPHEQCAITARIRKRPPRTLWPKEVDSSRVESVRLHWSARELRRIEIANALLPKRDKVWLDARLDEFPDLVQMDRLDEGFSETLKVRSVTANHDSRYDLLDGEQRLKALETALSSARRGWDDDPAERAAAWMRHKGNPARILSDLGSIPDGGVDYPRVWEQFGWTHSPETGQGKDTENRDLTAESICGLSLLAKLPEGTVRQAINGITHWLSTWEKQLATLPEGLGVWLKLWPIAEEVTNEKQPVQEEIQLDTVAQPSDDRDPMHLDTLNSPAGKLVGFFLAACPTQKETPRPFDADGPPRRMRDTIIAATGSSRLIAMHRMIQVLPYFLSADPEWTNNQLITPLKSDSAEALTLWRAIALRTRFSDVLTIIGGPMSERAVDLRLGRKTRQSLVFSLIIECLHAFREVREPAVPYARIQQMIRSLDDEVRAYGANAVQRFVRDLSVSHNGSEAPSPEQLFRSTAAPFLQHVWPQERSLATPGVSRALADLPATAQEAFAEAVDVIERFLVPFECWSMIDYGLYGEKDGKPKLASIDNGTKAAAFLRLLDLTIGTAEGSVIPHELADALEQIREKRPNLAESHAFRRLAAAARRG